LVFSFNAQIIVGLEIIYIMIIFLKLNLIIFTKELPKIGSFLKTRRNAKPTG